MTLAILTVNNAFVLVPDPFLSPFDRPADYNGSEKFQLACHIDRLTAFMVDGTVPEPELYKCFATVKQLVGHEDEDSGDDAGSEGGEAKSGATGNSVRGRKKKVPPLSRQLIAANLLKIKLEDAKKFTAQDWAALMPTVPWRKFYHYYIVPLAQLCRALNTSTTTRANDKKLRRLMRRYVSGSRKVLGVPFMKEKTIFHRLPHVIHQAAGAIFKPQLCLIVAEGQRRADWRYKRNRTC